MYTHPQHGAAHDVHRLRQQGGKWLKDLREKRGLSQRQMARTLGLQYYTFISQLESGRGRIPPERYQLWAETLGIDLETFVKGVLRYYDPVTFQILFGHETHETVHDTANEDVAGHPPGIAE
jgi:transcriptional regulator with XRE-family HTH domain